MKTAKKVPFSFPVKDEQFRGFSNPGGIISICVMFAKTKEGVAVRDSKDPTKKTLYFTHPEWDKFTDGLKSGRKPK